MSYKNSCTFKHQSNTMKKFFTLFACLLAAVSVYSQTNVSGGIYSNATWTLANSPYIVTDVVVVFPDVVLTIEPGVTVKFNNDKWLEIRYAKLIAEGTAAAPITFTSNSGSPQPGSWTAVWLNNDTSSRFNYCNFSYADTGILLTETNGIYFRNLNFNHNKCGIFGLGSGYGPATPLVDSCNFISNTRYGIYSVENTTISNCNFINDTIAIAFWYSQFHNKIINCLITGSKIGIKDLSLSEVVSCTVKNCSTGIKSDINIHVRNCIIDSNTITGIEARNNDTIQGCSITNNGTGISLLSKVIVHHNVIENNSIGIKTAYTTSVVYCNRICSNTTYNLMYNAAFGANAVFAGNYWCTNDSATVAAGVLDGYDTISYSLAKFMPIDTTQCYQHICSAYFTLYPDNTAQHVYTAVNMAYGTGALSYVWNWGDGTTDTAAYPSHTYATAGIYPVCLTITDAAGCSSYYCNDFSLQHTTNTMVYVNVVPNTSTGITPTQPTTNFTLYPNPSNSNVMVGIDEGLVGSILTLTDLTGRVVLQSEIVNPKSEINIALLPSGIYLAVLTTANGQRAVKKLVKE